MSRRTIECYESVFRYIHQYLTPLFGEAIIIDFEKGMRKALLKTLKSIKSNMLVLGCWFHMCQALRRQMAKIPALSEKVKSNEIYADIFRRFQCLALLPMKYIESTFVNLSKEALKLDKSY